MPKRLITCRVYEADGGKLKQSYDLLGISIVSVFS